MLWILGALAVILLIVVYRDAYYSDTRIQQDHYHLMQGKNYDRNRDRMLELIREMDNLPYERVSITAMDGIRLTARYYHVKTGAPVQILFHGYRGTPLRDLCGGNQLALQAGHNTLVVDERAHGQSGGHVITFGVKERYDCLCWARYVYDRFGKDVPVFLSGISMGAATVLMASDLELPDNVVGVMADCPYSSPGAIIKKVCRDRRLPVFLAYPFAWLAAVVFGHFCLNESSAVRAAAHTRLPILLIHGEADGFVPCEMSREIYNVCKDHAVLALFPGADHGLSFIQDPDKYAQTQSAFIRSCLSGFYAARTASENHPAGEADS